MYRTVRNNALAFEADASSCLAILAVPVVVVLLVAKGCGLGPFDGRPPTRWRDLVKPAPAVAPADPAPVVSRSKARAAWDKARGVWRALRDE